MKESVTLWVVCRRKGCERLSTARSKREQRRRKYCSRRCAAIVNKNIGKTTAARRAEILAKSIHTRKQQVLNRIAGLTPLEAFRLGYKLALKSKAKQLRAIVEEIRAARAAGKGRAA